MKKVLSHLSKTPAAPSSAGHTPRHVHDERCTGKGAGSQPEAGEARGNRPHHQHRQENITRDGRRYLSRSKNAIKRRDATARGD